MVSIKTDFMQIVTGLIVWKLLLMLALVHPEKPTINWR